ncbi:hypothetical protein EYF80_016004 [Liparis tanakae]|uniref:Uncharacterized protein n=1 Tax=Liparis tanakae TaxID=230148 RepID=A0A4Z2I6W3_9TELE|nr:hypothetical protein EYF80_016004 [Liparis tanakae]
MDSTMGSSRRKCSMVLPCSWSPSFPLSASQGFGPQLTNTTAPRSCLKPEDQPLLCLLPVNSPSLFAMFLQSRAAANL